VTASEEQELALLRRLQAQAHDHVYEIITVLRVFLGELDLAVIHARKKLDEFYEKHPELK
jgi:hypothetical protein